MKKRIAAYALLLVVVPVLVFLFLFGIPLSRSAAKGPLVYTARMSKNHFAAGEEVVVHTTLKNVSQAPVGVYPLYPSVHRYLLDENADMLARRYSAASTLPPGPNRIVRLAPGASLHFQQNLRARQTEPFLDAGVHRLVAEYDTTRLPSAPPGWSGLWRGRISAGPLVFTIVKP